MKNLISERMTLASDDIINIYRLGEKHTDKTRPLLLKVKSEKKANGI